MLYDKDANLICYTEGAVYNDKSVHTRLTCRQNVADSSQQVTVICSIYPDGTRYFRPDGNGNTGLGINNHRWGQIWSTSATIQTSDGRLKTSPETLPDDVLDAWGDIQFVQFQMRESVKNKGKDKARLHNGLIAQDVDEAFKSHGLDIGRYGLFCWDEWDEETETRAEDGHILREHVSAGDMYSLRYEEALCMEAAYQRRENRRLKDRVSELENKVLQLEDKLNQLLNK